MSADFTHLYSPHAEQSVIGALLLASAAIPLHAQTWTIPSPGF